jgi:hypothetical protein
MATDFDQFPLNDDLVKRGTTQMSDIWAGAISYFYQNLIGYLTAGGIFLPQVTTTQRDALTNVKNGQVIYNTTLGTAQYFKAGAWSSF